MAQTIQVDSCNVIGSLTLDDSKKKSAKVLAASLCEMEQMFGVLATKKPTAMYEGALVAELEATLLADPKQRAAREAYTQLVEEIKKAGVKNVEKALQETVVPVMKSVSEAMSKMGAPPVNNSDESAPRDGGIAMALEALQGFQTVIAQQKIDQNKNMTLIGQNETQSAQDEVDTVAADIQNAMAAAAKAAEQPWWEVFVQVVAILAGSALAAATSGAGAAVLALVVGSIMATPLSAKLTAVIATAVIDAQGVATGEDAQERQQAIADIIAKVCVACAFVIVSGAVSFGTTMAGTAADVAVEAGETATADATAGATSKLGSALWTATKMGTFEGVSSLTSSGVVSDVMTAANPEWAKSKLAAALAVIITFIITAITMAAGSRVLKGVGQGASLAEKYASAFKVIIPASYLAQMAQAAVAVGLGVKRAEYLNEEADYTEDLAQDQASLGVTLAALNTISDAGKKLNSSESSIFTSVTQEMDAIAANSGAAASTVNQVLASG